MCDLQTDQSLTIAGPCRQHIHSKDVFYVSFLLCLTAAPIQIPFAMPLQSYLVWEITCYGVPTHLFLTRVRLSKLAMMAKQCSFYSRLIAGPSVLRSLYLFRLDFTKLRLSWITNSLNLFVPTFQRKLLILMWLTKSRDPQIYMKLFLLIVYL